jgi:DNA replication protein DnaC
MLHDQTLALLHVLKLRGMAEAYQAHHTMRERDAMSFEERFVYLLEAEQQDRTTRRLTRLVRQARFRFPSAAIEHVIFTQRPGLERSVLLRLARGEWITQSEVTILTGATGTGKSWLACALGHAACRRGHTVRYTRVSELCDELALLRAAGTHGRLLTQLQQADLLILDDWAAGGFTDRGRQDLLDILEDRYDRRATLVTSQFPVREWHALIGNPTVADALLDRLVHHAHRIELTGESLRKRKGELTGDGPTGPETGSEPPDRADAA